MQGPDGAPLGMGDVLIGIKQKGKQAAAGRIEAVGVVEEAQLFAVFHGFPFFHVLAELADVLEHIGPPASKGKAELSLPLPETQDGREQDRLVPGRGMGDQIHRLAGEVAVHHPAGRFIGPRGQPFLLPGGGRGGQAGEHIGIVFMDHNSHDMLAGAGSLAIGLAAAVVKIGVPLTAKADLDVKHAVPGVVFHVGAQIFFIKIVPVPDDAADLTGVVAGDATQVGLPVFGFPGNALERKQSHGAAPPFHCASYLLYREKGSLARKTGRSTRRRIPGRPGGNGALAFSAGF